MPVAFLDYFLPAIQCAPVQRGFLAHLKPNRFQHGDRKPVKKSSQVITARRFTIRYRKCSAGRRVPNKYRHVVETLIAQSPKVKASLIPS